MDSKLPESREKSVWQVFRQGERRGDQGAMRRAGGSRSSSTTIRARGIERCYTVRQVAALLGYSEKTLRRLCHQGKIRTVQSSPRAQHRIPLSAVQEFFERSQYYWAFRSQAEFEQAVLDAYRSSERSAQEVSAKPK